MVPWAIAGRARSAVTRVGAERGRSVPTAAPESVETKDRREGIAHKDTLSGSHCTDVPVLGEPSHLLAVENRK
jgi:hypothetical protein